MLGKLITQSKNGPKHVAIIMDGNRRWARQNNLSSIEGHQKGSQVAREIVKAAVEAKIPYLTLYTFSSENWKRNPEEIAGLMELLEYSLRDQADSLHKEGVALRVIGERYLLPPHLLNLIEEIEARTKNNTTLTLQTALSYGSRAEIAHAAREIAKKAVANQIKPDQITEQDISQHLYTAGIPDPDLLIRTGGEQRISNYLLWQLAYTELIFVDKFWPEFTPEDFYTTLSIYHERERRFGSAE